MTLYLIIRVKGTVNVRDEVERTLWELNLRRKFNATVVPFRENLLGMLQKAKDYIVWGEISREQAAELFRARGRTSGWRKLTEDYLKARNINGFDELVKLIEDGKVKLKELGIKPYFAMPPPRRGLPKSMKADEILRRMMENGN